MKAQKYFGVMVILALLFALVPSTSVSAAASKVPVCHLDKDSGAFILINISDNAYDSHLNHGDVNPGDPIPGMLGMTYGEDCAPVRVFADVTGTWTGASGLVGNLAYTFTMILTQDGTSVNGTIVYSIGITRNVTGTVIGSTFEFTTAAGYWATFVAPDTTGSSIHGFGFDSSGYAVEILATK